MAGKAMFSVMIALGISIVAVGIRAGGGKIVSRFIKITTASAMTASTLAVVPIARQGSGW